MVVKKEAERPFLAPLSFATFGVPRLFEYPRLRLTDEESGEIAYWSNSSRTSQLLHPFVKDGRLALASVPDDQLLNLKSLVHPITNAEITIDDPLRELEVRPTPELHSILLEVFGFLTGEKPELRRVKALPFTISSGVLKLDLTLALNAEFSRNLGSEIVAAEVSEFETILTHAAAGGQRGRLKTRLHSLGEKCAHMSDTNCGACLTERRYLCLRSLLARFFRRHLLLAHKGIELSDLQGRVTIGGEASNVFVFSKLARGNSTLTLRNDAGAVLFSQIAAQIDKTAFTVVAVLTPSVINEDLRERIMFLAGLMGKRVLFVGPELLMKMLSYFEEQTSFDKQDVTVIYRASEETKPSDDAVAKGSGPFVPQN